jgi:hypothetical protein
MTLANAFLTFSWRTPLSFHKVWEPMLRSRWGRPFGGDEKLFREQKSESSSSLAFGPLVVA